MKFLTEKRARILAVLIMVCSLMPVLVIGIYDHPSADDYGYSLRLHELLNSQPVGIIDVLKCAWDTSMHYMQTWQGLYSSAFLLAMQPAVFGERYYAITVFVIVLSCMIGITALFYSICKNLIRSDAKGALFLSVLMLFYVIQGMPVPSEGLYWFNGAVNYLFFWGILLLYAALLIRFMNKQNAYGTLVIASVLGFILSGGNHITAFIGILFSLIMVVTAVMRKKGFLVAVPAVLEITGFIINITSPGTAIRAAQDGTKSSVIKTVIRCGYEALTANSKYMTFSLLLICLISIPAVIRIVSEAENKSIFTVKNLVIFVIFDFAVISAMYCVPYYAMGVFGEGRVEDTIYASYSLLFFLTVMFGSGVFAVNCKKFDITELSKNEKAALIYRIAMIAAVCYVALIGNALKDYSTGMHALTELADGSARSYHQQNMDRLEKFNAEDSDTVVVDSFTEKPILLYFRDMSVDGTEWPNTTMEAYFGKKSISRKKMKEEE